MQFDDCLKLCIGIVNKLRQRSPLRYKLTIAVSALNPVIIYYNPDLGKKRINELLVILHDLKRINATAADKANSQHQEFCGIAKVSHRKEFKNFNCYKSGLDDF